MARRYPSDLSDSEWQCLKLHVPATKHRVRPRLHSSREILDAVFYVLKAGRQWRMLPKDFPPWQTVYHYFRGWRVDDTWERIHRVLRERVRALAGRSPDPSAEVVDSQSAKTTGVARRVVTTAVERSLTQAPHPGGHRGASPQGKGSQRQGPRLRRVKVTAGVCAAEAPRLSYLWVDAGYRGRGKEWAASSLGLSVEAVHRSPKPTPEKVLRAWTSEGVA